MLDIRDERGIASRLWLLSLLFAVMVALGAPAVAGALPAPIATGTVTNAGTTNPIEYAVVSAYWYNASEDWIEWAGDGETGPDGVYAVHDDMGYGAGDYEFYAGAHGYANGYSNGYWDGGAALTEVDFVLEPLDTLAYGTVTDSATGDPVWDAHIEAAYYDSDEDMYIWADDTFTESDGSFILFDRQGFGPGYYSFTTVAGGYLADYRGADWVGGPPLHLEISLDLAPPITSGTIRDAVESEPIEGAIVTAQWFAPDEGEYYWAGETSSDEDGTYTVSDNYEYGAGNYEFLVNRYMYQSDRAEEYWDGGDPLTGVDFYLEPSLAVATGTVTDATTGDPLEASVSALWYSVPDDEYWWTGDTYTDESGAYTVQDGNNFGEGDYQFVARSYSYESGLQMRTWNGSTLLTGVNFALYGADPIASGTVRDADTQLPITEGWVSAEWYDEDYGEYWWIDSTGLADDGTYAIYGGVWDDPEPGLYRFSAEGAYPYAIQTKSDIWNGVATLEIDFELVLAVPVAEGTVTDAATTDPIEGIYVTAAWYDHDMDCYDWAGYANTDEFGFYSVPDLTVRGAGDYEIYAEGYPYLSQAYYETWGGGDPLQVDFELESTPPLAEGIVSDSVTSLPVKGIYVEGSWWDEIDEGYYWTGSDQTAADGSYRIHDFEQYGSGDYRFYAEGYGYYTQKLYEGWDGGEPLALNIVMVPTPKAAYGVVSDAGTNLGIDGASVFAAVWLGDIEGWQWVGGVSTYADGSYEIYGPEGDYDIWAWAEGYFDQEVTGIPFDGDPPIEQDFALVSRGPKNRSPVAVNDSYSTNYGQVLTVNAPGVLANDSDPDGDAITAWPVTSPANGEVALSQDGAFTYTPDVGFSGVDTFTYRASDTKAHSNIATVSITVKPQVFPPVIPIAGDNRFDTAVAASTRAYPDGLALDGKRTVVIATGMNWPDALGGTSLAGALDGPVLLVNPTSVPEKVMTEITRLKATKAIILGGTGAVSTGVEQALKTKLGSGAGIVRRIDGANRYETADKIAKEVITARGKDYDGYAFVATGGNFPDALAAAPLAAAKGWPLYLADPTAGLSAASKTAMDGVSDVVILGGTGAVSAPTKAYLDGRFPGKVTRLDGDNRYQTAAKIAKYAVDTHGHVWNFVGITTGENFPDALAGGIVQGKAGSVMLLTTPTVLQADTKNTLVANKSGITTVTFYGGTNAVSASVRTAVSNAIK
jgi:putative cell wall-binding protein